MGNTELVSVIIPVYNGERYLADAINSAVEQTYRSIEIIVVDDGSKDGSAAVAQQFESIRYYHQPNGGISAARNSGVRLAQGTFFAFLDADDVWMADKLNLQLQAFKGDPDLDIVFGHARQFYSPELSGSARTPPLDLPEVMPGYIPSTMLIKRASFFRIGLFETDWKMGEFASWYLRANELGLRKVMLPDLVAGRRLHDENNGIRQRHALNDYLRIIKASLDRRRAMDNAEAGEAAEDL